MKGICNLLVVFLGDGSTMWSILVTNHSASVKKDCQHDFDIILYLLCFLASRMMDASVVMYSLVLWSCLQTKISLLVLIVLMKLGSPFTVPDISCVSFKQSCICLMTIFGTNLAQILGQDIMN